MFGVFFLKWFVKWKPQKVNSVARVKIKNDGDDHNKLTNAALLGKCYLFQRLFLSTYFIFQISDLKPLLEAEKIDPLPKWPSSNDIQSRWPGFVHH